MKLMLTLVIAATLSALALRAATSEQPAKPAKPFAAADTKFVIAASQDGETELRLGELAMRLGPSPQVRDFGSLMVSDHGKANAELKALCSRRGVVLPAELDPDHQQMLDDLAKKNGTEFQDAYVNAMVAAHKTAIATFEAAAKSTIDPELKSFIETTLPTLRHHLQSAEALKLSGK